MSRVIANETQSAFLKGFNDRIGTGTALILGLQLVMGLAGLFIFPGVLGRAFNMSSVQTAELYGATFVFSGLCAILSAVWLLRIPIIAGPWAGAVASYVALSHSVSFGTLAGSMAVACLIWVVLSLPIFGGAFIGLIDKYMRHPLIYGGLQLIIMTQIAAITLPNWIGSPAVPGFGAANWLGGAVCIAVMFGILIAARRLVFRRAALLLGVAAGTIVFAFIHPLNLRTFLQFPVLYHPTVFATGISWPIVAFLFFVILPVGYMSQFHLLFEWAQESPTTTRIAGGVFVAELVSAVGALFGSVNVGSYPDGLALLKVSRIASRWVAVGGGGILFVLGFILKFDALFVAIPTSVLAAGATLLFGIVFVNAAISLVSAGLDDMNISVMGLAFMLSIGGLFINPLALKQFPWYISDLLTNPNVTGTILLIGLSLLVNQWLRPILESRPPLMPIPPKQSRNTDSDSIDHNLSEVVK